jgi:hypothetical protein
MVAKEPLLKDLTPDKQEMLVALASHPGFPILVDLFHEACGTINKKLVALDPEDENYEKVLERYHLQSRVVNEFCSDILKAIGFHAQKLDVARKANEEEVRRLIEGTELHRIPSGNPLGRKTISGE